MKFKNPISFLVLFLLLSVTCFSQSIVNRANSSYTVQDSRFSAQYNLFVPRYDDTTSANLQIGVDSCSAIIYVYSTHTFWYRSCASGVKAWVEIGAGGGGSGTVTSIGITGSDFSITGSPVTTSGNIGLTLATVNSNVGSFGSATQAGTFTVNAKGLITAASNTTITPAVGSITGLGTGVATALAVNTGSAGAFVVNGGALGTPSSGILTNATGLPLTTGITGTLAFGNGGTGLAALGTALQQLRVNAGATALEYFTPSSSGTVNSGTQYRLGYYATTGDAISEAAAITGDRALISDVNGVPTHSATTATEIGYVNGVTSAIQTQIDGKIGGSLTATRIPFASAATTLIDAGELIWDNTGKELRIGGGSDVGAFPLQVYKAANPVFSVHNGTQFTNIFTGSSLSIFQFPVANKFGIQAATSITDNGASGVYPLIAFGSGNSHAVLIGGVAFSATPNARLDVRGSFATQYTATATSLTADITHSTINVTATGQTITLPTAVGISGRIYTVKLTASGSGTVNTTSSQTIDGSTTYSLSAQYKFVTVQSDNANWIIIGNN